LRRQDVVHATRTATAAGVSLEIAYLLKLPEPYWAAITTLIITALWPGEEAAQSGGR
jgi:uncharacterized membrane protein YccC